MTAKEWLERGICINAEIKELQDAQEEAYAEAVKSVASYEGERVQTSRRNGSENRFVKFAAYSELITRRQEELYEVKAEILEAINKVEDGILRTILLARYVNCKDWQAVAESVHYSREWVTKRLHPLALNKFSSLNSKYFY